MVSTDSVLQIGVGGLVAMMILEKVFAFLKSRKNGKDDAQQSSGEKAVEYWHMAIDKIVKDIFVTTLLPELIRQTKVLEAILSEQRELSKEIAKLAKHQ